MIERGQLHIDGTWRSPHGDGTIDVIDAHDETVMGRVPSGDAQDAIAAIEAAHRAASSAGTAWPSTANCWR